VLVASGLASGRRGGVAIRLMALEGAVGAPRWAPSRARGRPGALCPRQDEAAERATTNKPAQSGGLGAPLRSTGRQTNANRAAQLP